MSNTIHIKIKPKQIIPPWDGSCLGLLNKHNFIEIIKLENKLTMYHIKTDKYDFYCYGRKSNSSHQCICDELKVIFGIRKLGTHWCKYGQGLSVYIFWPIRYNTFGQIQDELKLNQLGYVDESNFVKQVQNIFVFRDLINVGVNFENTIIVRQSYQNNKKPYPISYKETTINPHKHIYIPNTVYSRWFKSNTINDALCRIFNITHYNQIADLIFKIRSVIQDIINRVDNQNIWLENYIIERLHERLNQSKLSYTNINNEIILQYSEPITPNPTDFIDLDEFDKNKIINLADCILDQCPINAKTKSLLHHPKNKIPLDKN